MVGAHNASPAQSPKPEAWRPLPRRLFSAVTVGVGLRNNLCSRGPGPEFCDAVPLGGAARQANLAPNAAAGWLAGKLARILEANLSYHICDARQHLRQSASAFAAGWREDGGFDRPQDEPAELSALDPAPPLDVEAVKSEDSRSVAFSWVNFRQSSFTETVIRRKNGSTIYHGTGTNYVWASDAEGEEAFNVHSRDRSGRLSKAERVTAFVISGLSRQ